MSVIERLILCLILIPAISGGPAASAQEGSKTEEPAGSTETTGPAETVPVESKTEDSDIDQRLLDILTSADRYRNLEVEVQEGIVFLSGETSRDEDRRLATEVARKVEGVVAVINDIRVESTPIRLQEVLSHLLHLAIAYALALPIGWDRERAERSAGLRTFPLVSMASCGYMLIALYVIDGADAQARVMYGIITGIGFIGGGAILRDKGSVRGTATAASIWTTAAIGVAVAWRHFEIAVVLSAVNFATLRWVGDLKSRMRRT